VPPSFRFEWELSPAQGNYPRSFGWQSDWRCSKAGSASTWFMPPRRQESVCDSAPLAPRHRQKINHPHWWPRMLWRGKCIGVPSRCRMRWQNCSSSLTSKPNIGTSTTRPSHRMLSRHWSERVCARRIAVPSQGAARCRAIDRSPAPTWPEVAWLPVPKSQTGRAVRYRQGQYRHACIHCAPV
jgi:hypothetical protein